MTSFLNDKLYFFNVFPLWEIASLFMSDAHSTVKYHSMCVVSYFKAVKTLKFPGCAWLAMIGWI